MKLKDAVLACLVALISAWVFVHAQTPSSLPSSGVVGRYQVVAADIDYTGMGGVLKHKTAIKIDTQTGQTWEFTEIQDDKTHGIGFYWVKSNPDVK